MNDLKILPHHELLKCARRLMAAGHEFAPALAEHLREIERRQLHVELGFARAQDFLARELGSGRIAPSRSGRTPQKQRRNAVRQVS